MLKILQVTNNGLPLLFCVFNSENNQVIDNHVPVIKKEALKLMKKFEENYSSLEKASEMLCNLIDSGVEYPEAEYKTLQKFFLVSQCELMNFYDSL